MYVLTLVRTDTSASTATLARTYTNTNTEVLTGDVEDVHDRDNNAPKVYSKVHDCSKWWCTRHGVTYGRESEQYGHCASDDSCSVDLENENINK